MAVPVRALSAIVMSSAGKGVDVVLKRSINQVRDAFQCPQLVTNCHKCARSSAFLKRCDFPVQFLPIQTDKNKETGKKNLQYRTFVLSYLRRNGFSSYDRSDPEAKSQSSLLIH